MKGVGTSSPAGVRDDTAELRISFNPLVVWVWIGGMVMGDAKR